jgi:hypothetical protein
MSSCLWHESCGISFPKWRIRAATDGLDGFVVDMTYLTNTLLSKNIKQMKRNWVAVFVVLIPFFAYMSLYFL